jgi:GntR family transcriptional regulator, arabinose operon transcriptional repressor
MAKYLDLVQWLKDKIQSGTFKPGDQLPTENELCVLFQVSRQTTRQALGVLAAEGLIECRRGSGSYVSRTLPRPGGRQANGHQSGGRHIGVVTTYLDDYIFPSIIRGIESALAGHGYTMQLAITSNDLTAEARILSDMLSRDLDGLIIEPSQSALPTVNWPLYRRVAEEALPCVLIHSTVPGLSIPCVANDDFAGGQLAAAHLLANGHRRIGGIFKSDDLQGHLRAAGFAYALQSAGITADPALLTWYTTADVDALFGAGGERLIQRLAGCTAVLCYNDQIAYQLCALLRRSQIGIPDQISVVGFDNSALAELIEGGLTTVAHPMETLGRIAAENLVRRIGDPGFDPGWRFAPQLIERLSVARIGDPIPLLPQIFK